MQITIASNTDELVWFDGYIGVDNNAEFPIGNYGTNVPYERTSSSGTKSYTLPIPPTDSAPWNPYKQAIGSRLIMGGKIRYTSESKTTEQSFTLNGTGSVTLTFNKFL